MRKLPARFALVLLACLGTAFGFHLLVLFLMEKPMWNDLILLSYVLNYIMAVGIFLTLFYLKDKLSNSIGFLFMGGSLLKFIIFFLVFYPTYKSDGEMQGSEFAAFFMPYLIALVLETFFASKMLQKMEVNSKEKKS